MTTRMDYQTFLSNFVDGISRPNRYRVEFNLPRGVNLSGGALSVNDESTVGRIAGMEKYFNSGGMVNIKCHTMTFPQRSLLTMEHRQNSAPFRTPYSATYDPVTFSFYADSTMDTREYFEVWQSAVCVNRLLRRHVPAGGVFGIRTWTPPAGSMCKRQ